jgi:hypothetical protein
MPAELLHLHLDESGKFESARDDEVMVLAVLGRWDDRPSPSEVASMWDDAWSAARPGPPPLLPTFHANQHKNKEVLAAAAGALATAWSAEGQLVVASCPWRVADGAAPPDYLDLFVSSAACAIVACVERRHPAGTPLPPLTVRVEAAYRRGFNTWAAERIIERRVLAALRLSGRGGVGVTVCVWVNDVRRSVFLVLSDLLGNVAWRAMQGGGAAPFGMRVALDEPLIGRLTPAQLEWIRGVAVRTAEPMLEVPQWSARPALADLYQELLSDNPPDAGRWIDAHAADPTRLQPEERAAIVEDILLMGDLLVETRRAWEPARRALALARDLSWHVAWREGWSSLSEDRVALRLDTLALVHANHEGRVVEAEFSASRARAARLMAADCDTELVLVHHNRECVGLTNAFQFESAFAHLKPVLDWLSSRGATSPFGQRSSQLGHYFGTAGQLFALRAHAAGDPSLLDDASQCFQASLLHDDDPGHQLRQETYQIHLLAERVRLRAPGWGPTEVAAVADRISSSRAALDRFLADPLAARGMGDAFRVHALAKLAAISGQPFPEAAALAELFAKELPDAHPWPLLAAWLLPLASARPSWRFGEGSGRLKRALALRSETPDLVGFTLGVVLLDASPSITPAVVARIAERVPESIRQGWADNGYAERLGRLTGAGRMSDLLPFNFC